MGFGCSDMYWYVLIIPKLFCKKRKASCTCLYLPCLPVTASREAIRIAAEAIHSDFRLCEVAIRDSANH